MAREERLLQALSITLFTVSSIVIVFIYLIYTYINNLFNTIINLFETIIAHELIFVADYNT